MLRAFSPWFLLLQADPGLRPGLVSGRASSATYANFNEAPQRVAEWPPVDLSAGEFEKLGAACYLLRAVDRRSSGMSDEKVISSIGYGRQLEAPFTQVLERARKALQAEGFGVLCEIDVREKMKEKLGSGTTSSWARATHRSRTRRCSWI
jgi:hypothetical protein